MELYTEIKIQATADRVWQHLTDLDDFHLWNPFITSAQGTIRLKEKVQIHVQLPQGKDLNSQTTIVQVEPKHKLSWRGQLIIPGLLDIVHSFTIDPIPQSGHFCGGKRYANDRASCASRYANDRNSVRFSQREKFSGLIVPLLAKDLKTKLIHGFELMNQALKVRAESLEP